MEAIEDLGVIPATGRRFDPLTEAELEVIEERLGSGLPSSYRALLLKYGAFAFEVSVRCPRGGISYFYGKSTRSNPAMGLDWNLGAFRDVLPRGMIAVAADSLGNQICLTTAETTDVPSAAPARRGSVWFWVRGALAHEAFLEISPSFELFIESLTADEYDE